MLYSEITADANTPITSLIDQDFDVTIYGVRVNCYVFEYKGRVRLAADTHEGDHVAGVYVNNSNTVGASVMELAWEHGDPANWPAFAEAVNRRAKPYDAY